MGKYQARNDGLIYPELCYKIIGLAFEVFNELQAGHKEKVYHKAMSIQFKESLLKSHFDQLNHYLQISNLKLGLLISFTSRGVRFKRVVNLK